MTPHPNCSILATTVLILVPGACSPAGAANAETLVAIGDRTRNCRSTTRANLELDPAVAIGESNTTSCLRF